MTLGGSVLMFSAMINPTPTVFMRSRNIQLGFILSGGGGTPKPANAVPLLIDSYGFIWFIF